MFEGWVVFPVVLALVSIGVGLLLGWVAGVALPVWAVAPAGFAGVVVVSGFTTVWSGSAGWTVPVVVVLAAVGFVRLPRRWPDGEVFVAAGVGLVVFLVFGAPVLASGEATFAGYVNLDDTATFVAMAEAVVREGRDLSGLPPSSYEAALAVNLGNGYPVGALAPLGVGGRLAGADALWLWQPYLAFAAVIVALALYGLGGSLLRGRGLRAGASVVAACSPLLLGFALWGGVKELVAAGLLVLAAAALSCGRSRARMLVPSVACAAFLMTLGAAAVLWLLPLLVVSWLVGRWSLRGLLGLVVTSTGLSLPVALAASSFLRADNVEVFRNGGDLGNLVQPLPLYRVLGVWPAGDFRAAASAGWLAAVLLGVVAMLAVVGAVVALRRRAAAPLGLLASVLVTAVLVELLASPWLSAKALAIGSPVVLFVAAFGCVLMLGWGETVAPAAMLAGTLLAGVVLSDALAYRAVWLAPSGQLRELERIGKRFAGEGPALMTEYQPYGVRYLLRRLAPEGASELRRRRVERTNGRLVGKGQQVDLDGLAASGVLVYRTLVLRRSPVASRPSAAFRLAERGAWYEVWSRRPGVRLLARLPLGSALDPSGVARCDDVRALAARAKRAGAVLVASRRARPVIVALGGGARSSSGAAASGVAPAEGEVAARFALSSPDRYVVWLAGSVRGTASISIDGVDVGLVRNHIGRAGTWARVGVSELAASPHRLAVRLSRSRLRPGEGGPSFPLGPIALVPAQAGSLRAVPVSRATVLCGQRLDWLEAVTSR